MTPYTKKIVELHKIHKAIEEKDCCNGGGENTPSDDITIDDVVKFIHDNYNSPFIEFPYTTWDSIPNFEDVNSGICKTDNPANRPGFSSFLLSISQYIIGQKMGDSPGK